MIFKFFVLFLVVASAFPSGSPICAVLSDGSNIQMPQKKNTNKGVFSASVLETAWTDESIDVTLAGGSMDGFLLTAVDRLGNNMGEFVTLNDYTQLVTNSKCSGAMATHTQTSTWGNSRNSVTLAWIPPMIIEWANITATAYNTTAVDVNITTTFDTTIFYVFQPLNWPEPSSSQIVEGLDWFDQPAETSGTFPSGGSVIIPYTDEPGFVYFAASAANTSVYFTFYALSGSRGVSGEFFRSVETDGDVLTLPSNSILNMTLFQVELGVKNSSSSSDSFSDSFSDSDSPSDSNSTSSDSGSDSTSDSDSGDAASGFRQLNFAFLAIVVLATAFFM